MIEYFGGDEPLGLTYTKGISDGSHCRSDTKCSVRYPFSAYHVLQLHQDLATMGSVSVRALN